MKIKRRYLGEILRAEYDRMIAENFFSAFAKYDSFFIYNSFGTEADTKNLIAGLFAEGKKVYLPKVEGNKMVAVPYFGGELKKGKFGIEEPEGESFSGEMDIAVIPLLAVSDKGYRIGYGGGYYDRFLKDKKIIKAGIGYGFQFEDFTPEPQDIPLDIYLCERGIYTFDEKRKST